MKTERQSRTRRFQVAETATRAAARQYVLALHDEIVADWFAGGGGMAEGIQQAIGRHVDVSCNHDADAISMHMANHPQAVHFQEDVRAVCARMASQGLPVGLFHMSPDCTHHSQAKGGQPRDRSIRALSWVGLRWAGQVRPRIITLENVKEILKWGPLIAKRDPATGRVVKLDGSVAAAGERVPVQQQFLVPDPKRAGQTWRRFVAILRGMGYDVDWRTLCAADYGVPTTRTRLFMVARCDGAPIVWPEPTHFKNPKKGQKRWRAAAECIDWSIPGRSIFDRPRPLADATMRRIAAGMRKYVLEHPDPFIVPMTHPRDTRVHAIDEPLRTVTSAHRGEFSVATPVVVPVKSWSGGGNDASSITDPLRTTTTSKRGEFAVAAPVMVPVTHTGDGRVHDAAEPLPTITTAKGGEFALAAATMVQLGYGEREGQAPRTLDVDAPLGTVVAGGGKVGLVTAFLAQANSAEAPRPGHDARDPVSTITVTGHQQQLVSAFLAQANGGFNATPAHDAREPASTITNKGSQQQLVTAHLAHLRGNCDARDLRDPLRTVSAGGEHHGVVEYRLSKDDEAGALRVAAFLMRYHGSGGQWSDVRDPMTTLTTRDRLALVTVWLKGEPWVIVDIQLRMLEPKELYAANGFPATYIIDRGHDGRIFSKSTQIRLCGNSVPPGLGAAVIRAQWNSRARVEAVAA